MKHKTDLIDRVAEQTEMSKADAGRVVDAVIDSIQNLAPEKLVLRGFGTFDIKHRKAREARNPRTGETVPVPARDVMSFKPVKPAKD